MDDDSGISTELTVRIAGLRRKIVVGREQSDALKLRLASLSHINIDHTLSPVIFPEIYQEEGTGA